MTLVEPNVDAEIWLGVRPHAVPELTVLFSLRIELRLSFPRTGMRPAGGNRTTPSLRHPVLIMSLLGTGFWLSGHACTL